MWPFKKDDKPKVPSYDPKPILPWKYEAANAPPPYDADTKQATPGKETEASDSKEATTTTPSASNYASMQPSDFPDAVRTMQDNPSSMPPNLAQRRFQELAKKKKEEPGQDSGAAMMMAASVNNNISNAS